MIVRILKRLAIFLAAAGVIWLIATQIFDPLDDQFSLFTALLLTYIISAYFILPRAVWFISLLIRRGHIPRFTQARDSMIADPVNLAFFGTKEELEGAFMKAGWFEADKLNLRSAIKMGIAFLQNKPYPKAPFSSLFLFGRRQDIGFQLPIGNSPRERHHVRFWAANVDTTVDPLDINYWMEKKTVDFSKEIVWIGAATKDVGFGFTKFTYQITHSVDPYVDEERTFILESMKNVGAITDIHLHDPEAFHVGKYISDGKIATAKLISS